MKVLYGKYKGEQINQVVWNDPRYALWAHKTVWWFNLSPDQVETAVTVYQKKIVSSRRYLDDDNDWFDLDEIPF